MSARFALVEVAAEADAVTLPHTCASGPAGLAYTIGERTRTRLRAGETVAATARCRLCDERIFASLVDPASRAERRAAARPDPSALRRPAPVAAPSGGSPGWSRPRPVGRTGDAPAQPVGPRGRPRLVPARSAEATIGSTSPPCPACGTVPDTYGLCRCSL